MKWYVKFFKSRSYLTGVAAVQLEYLHYSSSSLRKTHHTLQIAAGQPENLHHYEDYRRHYTSMNYVALIISLINHLLPLYSHRLAFT